MKKIKTSKSIVKRFQIKSKSKFLRHQASRSHLLQKKASKRKQKLRKVVNTSPKDLSNLVNKLPYIL